MDCFNAAPFFLQPYWGELLNSWVSRSRSRCTLRTQKISMEKSQPASWSFQVWDAPRLHGPKTWSFHAVEFLNHKNQQLTLKTAKLWKSDHFFFVLWLTTFLHRTTTGRHAGTISWWRLISWGPTAWAACHCPTLSASWHEGWSSHWMKVSHGPHGTC